jgi:hypothetical protein
MPPYASPAYAYPPVRIDAVPTSPTRARSPRRLSVWLLVSMVVLAVGIVVAAMAMDQTSDHREPTRVATVAPEPPTAPTAAAPTATTHATTTPATVIAPPVQPPREAPATPVANKPPAKTTRSADAGAEDAATPSVGFPGLPLPFPIPSAIPIPSALPLPLPLPSSFPPFGLPGFPQPAQAGPDK